MAKRKKTTNRKTHRRRRVSGIKDINTMGLALAVGGAVVAKIVNNKLAASTNATAQKAAPFAGIVLGVVLPMLSKSPLVKGLSIGLVAGGGVTALGPSGLKMISGFENTIAGRVGYPGGLPQLPYRKIAGLADGQGLAPGTRSNFSGSRLSQMNTIAGIAGASVGCSGANPME